MNKTSKFLFLGLTLLILFISVGNISATDNTDTTTTMSDNIEQDIHNDMADEKSVVKTTVTTKKVNSENKNITKKTIKTDKQPIKKSVHLIGTANDYKSLKTSWDDAQSSNDTTLYTINVKNGRYNFEEELTSNNISTAKTIIFNGESKDKTIFDGQGKTRFFNLNNTNQVIQFNNITFINGFNNSEGGAILANSTLKLNNTVFINNKVSGGNLSSMGGALVSYHDLSVYDSYFINNSADSICNYTYGGAIVTDNNTLIYNCSFINNSVTDIEGKLAYSGIGGAFYSNSKHNATINIFLCEFINNSANATVKNTQKPSGGAIYYSGYDSINITSCEFIDNKAYNGGAIFFYQYGLSGTVIQNPSVFGCVFKNNTATNYKNVGLTGMGSSLNIGANYYIDNSSPSDLYYLVNDKESTYTFNQKTNQITIATLINSNDYYGPLTMLGRNYNLTIISSSNLINTNDAKLTPENGYLKTFNLSNLPANHEDIILYVEDIEVAKIVWDHTNVVFNNITAKPGENILLNAIFKTSDNILIPSGRVAFKINDNTIGHSNIQFGTATLNYTIPSNYSAKDYKLTVVYGGNNEFIEARINRNLHLNKLNTTVDVKTSINGNTLKIDIDPKDENNNTINCGKICVKIEGKTLQNIKINGKTTVNFTIPKSWNNREIKVLAIYGENNNHKQSRMEITTKLTTKTVVKDVKKDEINNYYVSDKTGSDTNQGTQNSPFKTIQKAISTVNTNKQNANIYLDGQFKGFGNTNLTVPGDLHINFIGVGNSSIDGEVNYTIKENLSDNEYYWGSTPIWYPYNNGTGNWAMNITRGNGLITISNFTIKNCWNPGPSSNDYKTSTVDNYGNLAVNNVSFIFNHGGVGASIRNNNGSNLNVTNSLFEANRKSSSTGNYGAGIYNNGTAIIINSTFQKNYARWGTITNDKNLTIINSTIRDNIAYDGGSTFKTGSGITINTGSTTYGEDTRISNIVTQIDGCIFINNDQLDIYSDEGSTNITNNIFNKSTGVVMNKGSEDITINIKNNTFNSPIGSTLYTSLSSKDQLLITLKLRAPYHYVIDSNQVFNMGGTSSTALELKSNNAIITNNTFTRMILIDGEKNTIKSNNITTTKDQYTINLKNSPNNNIYDNYLKASKLVGDSSVSYTSITNKLENNTPVVKELLVDDEIFYKYFDDDGNLLSNYKEVEQIRVVGELNNKNININNNLSIFQEGKFTSHNITITVDKQVEISLLTIINTNKNPVIILNGNNNTIKTTTLTTNNNNTIIVNGENNIIENNTLITDILVGDESVKTTKTNTVDKNIPTYKNHILSEENFNTYFNTNGTIKDLNINEVHFLINGTIVNKNIILNNDKNIIITKFIDSEFLNTTIQTLGNTKLNITGIVIKNTDKVAFELESKENNITYTNITTNTNAINIKNPESKITISFCNIVTKANKTINTINIQNVSEIEINNTNIITQAPGESVSINAQNILTSLQFNRNTIEFNVNNSNAIKVKNGIVNSIRYNIINLNGENNTAINTNNVTAGVYNVIIYNNTISSDYMNSYAIVVENLRKIELAENRIYLNNKNSIAIILNSTYNSEINSNTIKLNASENTGILINNSGNSNIKYNELESIINTNSNFTILLLNNATNSKITYNNITTTGDYAIIIDKQSNNNWIEKNILLTNKNLGNNAVLNLNLYYNKVSSNKPGKVTYFYLNEKTYTDFFDENGNLKDIIPSNITILTTGNLYNKILTINKPINLVGDGVIFTNTTIILNAENINISGIEVKDNVQLQINSNNCNINLSNIDAKVNKPVLVVNGNNNSIKINKIEVQYTGEINKNTTIIEISGNKNNLNLSDISTQNYNEVTTLLLNNSNNSNISMSSMKTNDKKFTAIILNNSNNNLVYVNQINLNAQENEGIILTNSSYNKITGKILQDKPVTSILKLENNSNYNKIERLSIIKSNLTTTPIYIIESHYNVIMGGIYKLSNLIGYGINITESVGNNVSYNSISTANLEGNDCIIQENKNNTLNNIIRYNTKFVNALGYGTSTTLNITAPTTAKIYETIIINATAQYKKGAKYFQAEGLVIFKVNGEEIATIDLVNGSAQTNYTITSTDKLFIEAIFADPTLKYRISFNNQTLTVEKLDATIILPNVISNTSKTNLTAIVLDEKGNIITSGKVAFKLNGVSYGVTNIQNGIAQLTVDTSKLTVKNYTITTVYGGNDEVVKSTQNATLTITKRTSNIITPTTIKRTNNTQITINLIDENGNKINSNQKVCIKFNGCTITNTKAVNGTVKVNLDLTKYKNKQYNMTIICGENSQYNMSQMMSVLNIE